MLEKAYILGDFEFARGPPGSEEGFEGAKERHVKACTRALRLCTTWLTLMTHLQGPFVRREMSSLNRAEQGYAALTVEDANFAMRRLLVGCTKRMCVSVGVSEVEE